MSMISIPTPFAHDGLLYVTSGYVGDPFRKPVYAIKPGAKGDITLKKSEDSNAGVAWVQRQAGPYHPTPVVVGECLYVVHARGFLLAALRAVVLQGAPAVQHVPVLAAPDRRRGGRPLLPRLALDAGVAFPSPRSGVC